MNCTHFILWSDFRNACIVSRERVGGTTKPAFTRKSVATVVWLALSPLVATPALAGTGSCPTASTTISSNVTTTCTLNNNDSVTIDSGVSLSVTVFGGFAAGIYGIDAGASTGVTITNNGTIDVTNTGDPSAFAYSIRVGSGGTIASLNNSGTITATNSSSRESGVYVNRNGTITGLTNSGSISKINVDANATITELTNSGSISQISISGADTWMGDTPGTITTLNNSGTITTLDIAAADAMMGREAGIVTTLNNSGTISSAVAMDAGTLNLTGTSGSISGAVTGTGAVNVVGSFTTANTFSSGTFNINSSGAFTQGHAVTTSGGFSNAGIHVVTAGTTANVTGDYTQTANGTLRIGVGDDTTYGKLVVSGTATLPSNAKVDVNVTDTNFSFSATSMADIISAGTLASDGTFSVTDNSALFDFSAVKDGNTVDLTLAAASNGISVETAVSDSGNVGARGVATVLQSQVTAFTNNGTTGDSGMDAVVSALGSLGTSQQVADAASQTVPLLTGGSAQAADSALSGINRVVQARIEGNRGLSSGDRFYGDRHVWLKPFGSWADQDDRGGVSGFDADTWGLALGVDGTLSAATRLGAAFAYAQADVDGNSTVAPQSAEVDVYQLIAYGSHSLDANTDLDFQLGIGKNSNSGRRQIAFMSSVATSSYDSTTAHVGIGVSRALQWNERTSFIPSLRADYTWIEDENYTESGAGALNLSVASRSTEQLILALDGNLAHAVNDRATLTANLGVGYDTVGERASITAAFAGAPNAAFVTQGIKPERWLGRGGLGVVYQLKDGLEVNARYDAEVREDFSNQTASVNLRMPF